MDKQNYGYHSDKTGTDGQVLMVGLPWVDHPWVRHKTLGIWKNKLTVEAITYDIAGRLLKQILREKKFEEKNVSIKSYPGMGSLLDILFVSKL